ncbi:restriction endonuclease subunit S [Haloarcula sp. Atlit-7R]|uniref:restriction endonuclease subunit S n=1 Tax=Haloarcula sp. Atlit-7R TaxID=2282125 RepID=UPI001313EE5C|nr:restriction endonuclease subunit S [Haloarcula sp. Atlit-7R]
MSEQDIPNHWQLKEFETVVEILDKHREPISSENREKRIEGLSREDQYPYYGAGGQIGWIDDYIFDDDLILLAEDGATTGYTYRVSGKSWVNNHAHVLKTKEDHLSNDFLYYYLKSYDFDPLKTGSTRPKLTQTNMKKVSIPLPPLDEQGEIVDAIEERLDRVDTLSGSVRNIGNLTEEYEDSLLAFLFAGKESLSGEGPDQILTEQDIPDHWDLKAVEEVVYKAKNGGTPKRSEDRYWNGDIDWLSSGEVKGKEVYSADESITDAGLEETSAKLFPKDSILVAMYGATRGQSTILREVMSGNQAICCLELDSTEVLPEYTLYYFKHIKPQMVSEGKGGGQKNINQSVILEQKIPVPPLSEQEDIVNQIESVDMGRVNRAVEDLRELFDEYRNSVLTSAFRETPSSGNQKKTGELAETTI